MNVLLASSEVVPFAKTGGLADVCGSLPVELAKAGHNVAVIMPAYRCVRDCGIPIEPLNLKFDIPIGHKIVRGRLLRSELPGSNVPVFFIEQDEYFDRPSLYREEGCDYADNCERFAFFCRATLEAIRMLKLAVDVIHCNDWQTGLIPALLKIEYYHAQGYENISSLMTIHNMAYQGVFDMNDMVVTGLDWRFFNWQQMEFYGKLNLLKTGLVFADGISTVSNTYAKEIQTAPLGCGLEGVLTERHSILEGIVNGVAYDVWNPATDAYLPQGYDATNWKVGKAACKAHLQELLGLPARPDVPVIGMIGRLASQKGWDLVAKLMADWVDHREVQWVVLGTGEPEYHALLAELAARRPDRVAARLQFSEALAHQIEAGSDIFLMPSQYEPCGLNQLYSLRYGAVPVVRATGGLADTVIDATQGNAATGFAFEEYSQEAFASTLARALETYWSSPSRWSQIVETGMQQDWSWANSARRYSELYQRVFERHIQERQRCLSGN